MELPRVAAFTMIGGAILFTVAVIPMPAIYGVQEAADRIARIRGNEPAFLTSQALFGIAALVVAFAFVLLAAWLVARHDPLLPVVGAAAMVIGAALWAFFMVDRATNPEGYFRDYGHVPAYVWASVIASAIGLAAFGLLFIGPDRASWVGYLTLGVVAITIAGAVLAPEVTPPQLLYLPPLVMGSMLLVAGPPVLGVAP